MTDSLNYLEPERCPTCGCETAYPTAKHVLDCPAWMTVDVTPRVPDSWTMGAGQVAREMQGIVTQLARQTFVPSDHVDAYEVLTHVPERDRRRFTVRRLPLEVLEVGGRRYQLPQRAPWCVKDRQRPAWLGQVPTFDAAIATIDGILDARRRRDQLVEVILETQRGFDDGPSQYEAEQIADDLLAHETERSEP